MPQQIVETKHSAAIRRIAEWLDEHLGDADVMHAGIHYRRPSIVLYDVMPLLKAYPGASLKVTEHESSKCYELDADGIHFEAWEHK
jgi:hypothetical protein